MAQQPPLLLSLCSDGIFLVGDRHLLLRPALLIPLWTRVGLKEAKGASATEFVIRGCESKHCDEDSAIDAPSQPRNYLVLKLVGAIGFEPTTPCAQGRCATRLRYAPT